MHDRDSEAEAFRTILVAVADDEWMTGHRDSEWLGLAPDLEEDLALSSIAQDELGHAHFFYQMLQELGGPEPDQWVYQRPWSRWRHARFLEPRSQDFAELVVRRYLYEVFDDVRTAGLMTLPHPQLAYGLQKVRQEEAFHRRHFETWLEVLAFGGPVAQAKLHEALARVWPQAGDLFSWGDADWAIARWPEAHLDTASVRLAFEREVRKTLMALGIAWALPLPEAEADGRTGKHTAQGAFAYHTMRAVREVAWDSRW